MDIKRTKISELVRSETKAGNVLIYGWVKTKRVSKTFSFIEINDGSCLKNLQVIANNSLENYDNVRKITAGSAVYITGNLVRSKGSGQNWELIADRIDVVGTTENNFPLQKKRHSDEFLRSIAHLRARTNKYGAVFRIRSSVSWAIHNFFRERGFSYIHTPIITGSDCEGAGNMFKVTTLSHKNKHKTPDLSSLKDFFGIEANLTVSGQLSAEMLALSLGDVYTFGPTFRAENSNTNRHAAEFWMLEPEMAFCDIEGNMMVAEELIKYLIKFVMFECKDDFKLFSSFVDNSLEKDLEDIVSSKFVRIEYKDVINILTKANEKFKFSIEFGSDLQSEHEKYISEKYFKGPVIVFNYPKKIKPFYMRLNSDKETVAAMDILVPRVGEIIGGSQREERLDVLLERMKELSISEEKYWWYVDTRRHGSVIHSGFGMGLERFLMLVTGITNIRDVIPFPRTPGNVEF